MNAGNAMKSSWWCLKSPNSWQIILHKPISTLSYSAFQTAWTAANDTHRPKHQDHIQLLAKIQSPKSLCISIHGINEGNAGKAEVSWAYLHWSLRMEPHPPFFREKYRVFSSRFQRVLLRIPFAHTEIQYLQINFFLLTPWNRVHVHPSGAD